MGSIVAKVTKVQDTIDHVNAYGFVDDDLAERFNALCDAFTELQNELCAQAQYALDPNIVEI